MISTAAASPAPHFRERSAYAVPRLGVTLREFVHPCGARHWHLDRDDPHRAFAVAFRTLPEDSSGLPHILEHLSLCGSRRYPVRDPFFLMLRRSLQTFMNAFTYPDMTCYPFATQVGKDFDNLLGIYLDATFAPLLDQRDFAQEGWRLEPSAFPLPAGTDAAAIKAWAIKGVVFNEMKGAMGERDSLMFRALTAALLPTTCYRHNSGGEPLEIPQLRYQDLVDFHRSRYCGANACFATYGAVDLPALHARIEPYLQSHPGRPLPAPALQPALPDAGTITVAVPQAADQDAAEVGAAALAWCWGDTADPDELLLAELTDRVLFGHAAAPLRLSIEQSRLARSCGSSGFMSFLTNGVFSIELEGLDPARYGEVEPLVLQELQRLAREGIPSTDVEAALHQLELARRRIGGDGTPFGLQLCLRGIMAWNRGRDPIASLDQDAAIARLKQRVRAPGFWQAWIRERFLDHRHRVRLHAQPDPQHLRKQEEREAALLAGRLDQIDAAGRRALAAAAADLLARQAEPPRTEVLPRLELADVPTSAAWAQPVTDAPGLTTFVQPTNGLLHAIAAFVLPPLSDDERALLPLVTDLVGQLGVGSEDYQRWARRLTACSGGLSAWYRFQSDPVDVRRQRSCLFIEIRGLAERRDEFLPLLAACTAQQRHDEVERLAELLDEDLNDQQGRLLSSGMDLATAAAQRGFGGVAALSHELSGLGRLLRLRNWVDAEAAEELGARLATLWTKITASPAHLALIGDTAGEAAAQAALRQAWKGLATADLLDAAHAPRLPVRVDVPASAYLTASPVNYCGLALPVVPAGHPDAPALAVACQYLKDEVLHRRIREQGGAYGSAASYRGNAAAVTLGSYRDPRLDATFADLEAGLVSLTSIGDDVEPLRCAILGRIARIDAPSSPAGEARKRFTGDLLGNGPEVVGAFRAGLLAVTAADIRRVATAWLRPERATRTVLSSAELVAGSATSWERVSLS